MEDVELSMPIVVQPAGNPPNSVKWKGSVKELTMKVFLETSVESQVWVVQTNLPPNTSSTLPAPFAVSSGTLPLLHPNASPAKHERKKFDSNRQQPGGVEQDYRATDNVSRGE
jgi:hypothetical protein